MAAVKSNSNSKEKAKEEKQKEFEQQSNQTVSDQRAARNSILQ